MKGERIELIARLEAGPLLQAVIDKTRAEIIACFSGRLASKDQPHD